MNTCAGLPLEFVGGALDATARSSAEWPARVFAMHDGYVEPLAGGRSCAPTNDREFPRRTFVRAEGSIAATATRSRFQ